jgi:Fatty acid cis/trans isomerase (CTI)
LLVAGFDVFGTIAHQLQARLYMDFLRMEGEFNVLALLPVESRNMVRDRWYRDAPNDVTAHFNDNQALFFQQSGIAFKTNQSWPELARLWKQHLNPVLSKRYELSQSTLKNDRGFLKQLAGLHGKAVSYLPETVFITITDGQKQQHNFTLLRNSAHSNVSELFKESSRRLHDEDTLTLVPGFLGAYPNAFYKMEIWQLPGFIKSIKNLNSEAAYNDFSARFTIRRTNPSFWAHADTLLEDFRKTYPIEAGLFDFNRLENR